jgi:hypothetical protein
VTAQERSRGRDHLGALLGSVVVDVSFLGFLFVFHSRLLVIGFDRPTSINLLLVQLVFLGSSVRESIALL